MPLDSHWTGKIAVVCGASSGLGKSIALEIAKCNPAQLILLARREAPLKSLSSEILSQQPKINIDTATVDVCIKQDVVEVASKLANDTGIDLVVQAVGMSDRGSILDLGAERLNILFNANLVASLNTLQAFHPQLKKRKGVVTLIGSLASHFAPRHLGGYAIAKHALVALAQQARLELSTDEIHVCLACPGPIQRDDAGVRYSELESAGNLPADALKPGGGAKLKGLSPEVLAADILSASAKRKKSIIRPRKAWLLKVLSSVSPSLGDLILSRSTS